MICRHQLCDCQPASMLHSRRGLIAGAFACAAVLTAGAAAPVTAANGATADDERFMRLAIDEARQADFPFGAVIVRGGEVIARGRNLGKTNDDPTAHGEMTAIRRCLADHGSAALRGSTLYTSGEPCAMCMGAILWCHFGRLVFAASLQQLASKIPFAAPLFIAIDSKKGGRNHSLNSNAGLGRCCFNLKSHFIQIGDMQ